MCVCVYIQVSIYSPREIYTYMYTDKCICVCVYMCVYIQVSIYSPREGGVAEVLQPLAGQASRQNSSALIGAAAIGQGDAEHLVPDILPKELGVEVVQSIQVETASIYLSIDRSIDRSI